MALIKFNNDVDYTYNLRSFSRTTYYDADRIRVDVNIDLGTATQLNQSIYDLGDDTITSITFINSETNEILLTLSNLDYRFQSIAETWDEDHLNLTLALRLPEQGE